MPADMLIYSLREPKPPFQSWNEPLINKVKTSKGVASACVCVYVCVRVCVKISLMNPNPIILFYSNKRKGEKNSRGARVRCDMEKTQRASSHQNTHLFSRLLYEHDQHHYLTTTQKSQLPFKSKWRTGAHLRSLSSGRAPLATECDNVSKPNYQREITATLNRVELHCRHKPGQAQFANQS